MQSGRDLLLVQPTTKRVFFEQIQQLNFWACLVLVVFFSEEGNSYTSFFFFFFFSFPYSPLFPPTPIHQMSPSNSDLKRTIDTDDHPNPKRIHQDSAEDTTVSITATSTTSTTTITSTSKDTTTASSEMLGQLLVKKLSEKARIPTRGTKHAAGFDLYRCVCL